MTVGYDRYAPGREVEQATAPFEAIAPNLDEQRALRPRIAPPVRRVNNAWLFTLVAVAITVVGLLYLVQTSHVARLGYEVSSLERERMEKSLANQQLTYEIARQQSLPAVEDVARNQLHMRPIEQAGTRLYITVPQPADAELPLPEPEAGAELSLGGRIWARLIGTAHASNSDAADGAGGSQ